MALITAGQQVAEANDLGPTQVRAAINLALILGARDPRTVHDVARAGMASAARLGLKGSAVLLFCHAVEASVRMGDWSRATAEVDAMLVEGLEPADRIVLLSLAVYLRALMGGPADDLVAEMRAMIETTDEPTFLAAWHLTEGDVAFAAGRLGPAREAWRRSVAFATDYLPTVIALSARAALWEGDVDAARDDLATLDASGVHGPAVEASRLTIGAGLDALEGRATAAWARYREALQAWRDLGLAWDEAMCGLDMVSVLDPADPDVREVAASTREILVRLGSRTIPRAPRCSDGGESSAVICPGWCRNDRRPDPKDQRSVLTELARLARERFIVRFDYSDRRQAATQRRAEPYRIVNAGQRWYLVAWDLDRADWRTFRVDRMRPGISAGMRFTSRPLTDADAEALVARGIPPEARKFQARVIVHLPAERLAERVGPWIGTVEPLDDEPASSSRAPSGGGPAVQLGMLGADFRVTRAAGAGGGAAGARRQVRRRDLLICRGWCRTAPDQRPIGPTSGHT